MGEDAPPVDDDDNDDDDNMRVIIDMRMDVGQWVRAGSAMADMRDDMCNTHAGNQATFEAKHSLSIILLVYSVPLSLHRYHRARARIAQRRLSFNYEYM